MTTPVQLNGCFLALLDSYEKTGQDGRLNRLILMDNWRARRDYSGLRPSPCGSPPLRGDVLRSLWSLVELPTAWFVVSKLIANVLFFNVDYWNARCPFCLTMQDDA